ncbi:hypothetical protein LWI29_003735 [Acer saccharum]|uniref:DUF295 domain-containing protein n=1 Tax=Acer saccharum TaxID=4024 RepID=A0AA39SQI7_ACESA|nr:hypothetical protein LWI29_003735 [Acer saccharum]
MFTDSTRCVSASKSSDSQRDILHPVSMVQVQWSALPVEILPIIFQKLNDPGDVYRCGLVCVLWKSIVTTILPPFLLLSNVGTYKQSCRLFNTQTNQTHEIFLPELENCWFSSSSFGWLLTIGFQQPHEVHLLNHFTRDRIQLPSAKQLSEPYDLRVITSTSPLNPTCLVLAMRHFNNALAFCRPGDKSWTCFEDFGRFDNDVAFYKGEFYAVNALGHLVHLDCNIPVVQKALIPCSAKSLQRGTGQHSYLVELDGNLLLVVRYTNEELTSGFEVHEFDWVENCWIMVKNIGNNAILLGTGSSISLPISPFRNFKANCIYFINDNLSRLIPVQNTGLYDMTTGQIEYLYDQASLIWSSPLNWSVPQPNSAEVYLELNGKVRDAVISLINQEREGEQIDRALLKNVLDIFVEIGMGQMDHYENDFEDAMLKDTAAYYSKKASNWILKDSFADCMSKVVQCSKREKDRVAHYLHSSSEPKLLEALTHSPQTNLAEEPLGFGGIGFSPIFALLKSTFLLPLRPPPLAWVLSSKAESSPTDAFLHPTASANHLAPFIFGARALNQ